MEHPHLVFTDGSSSAYDFMAFDMECDDFDQDHQVITSESALGYSLLTVPLTPPSPSLFSASSNSRPGGLKPLIKHTWAKVSSPCLTMFEPHPKEARYTFKEKGKWVAKGERQPLSRPFTAEIKEDTFSYLRPANFTPRCNHCTHCGAIASTSKLGETMGFAVPSSLSFALPKRSTLTAGDLPKRQLDVSNMRHKQVLPTPFSERGIKSLSNNILFANFVLLKQMGDSTDLQDHCFRFRSKRLVERVKPMEQEQEHGYFHRYDN